MADLPVGRVGGRAGEKAVFASNLFSSSQSVAQRLNRARQQRQPLDPVALVVKLDANFLEEREALARTLTSNEQEVSPGPAAPLGPE